MRSGLVPLLAAVAALVAAAATGSRAQAPALHTGGARARVATVALAAGFSPDPRSIPLTLAGSLNASAMRLGPGCRGFVNAEPDFLLEVTGAHPMLRLFVRSAHDTTLVVRDPSGRFRCSDDVRPGSDVAPMVDLTQPHPGRYEIRVGSHDAAARDAATLFITADRAQRP